MRWMILLSCLGVACAEDSRNPVDGGPGLTDTAVGADGNTPDVRRADAELTDARFPRDVAPSISWPDAVDDPALLSRRRVR